VSRFLVARKLHEDEEGEASPRCWLVLSLGVGGARRNFVGVVSLSVPWTRSVGCVAASGTGTTKATVTSGVRWTCSRGCVRKVALRGNRNWARMRQMGSAGGGPDARSAVSLR
jgi:hypothetical protein